MSSATRPWPPSCAMVMALRESRHTRVRDDRGERGDQPVAMTSHWSGSGCVPKTRSQRSASEALRAVRSRCWSMSSGGGSIVGVRCGESGSVALMCGRYAASRRPEDLAGVFEVEKWEPEETLAPDWNVAPTKEVYAVLDRPVKDAADPRPVRQLRTLKWGLVPSWAQDRPRAAPG